MVLGDIFQKIIIIVNVHYPNITDLFDFDCCFTFGKGNRSAAKDHMYTVTACSPLSMSFQFPFVIPFKIY